MRDRLSLSRSRCSPMNGLRVLAQSLATGFSGLPRKDSGNRSKHSAIRRPACLVGRAHSLPSLLA
jgi:hypothetical protein